MLFTIPPTQIHASDPATSIKAGVQRSAFYLESAGQRLFTWLHRPNLEVHGSHGVVVCPPIGVEQMHSHRALRHLADEVAKRNLPVLRFDYHGTGDSPGVDEDAQRVATWQVNIRDAVKWMRRQLGCQQVSIIGLRMGGTLATLATEDPTLLEPGIESLVLWAPVVKGSRYFRELKAISMMVEGKAPTTSDNSGTIKAAGFVMTKPTAEAIGNIDLLHTTPRCRRALIVQRDDVAEMPKLHDHFSSLGIEVEQTSQPGYVAMMAEPHDTRVPQAAIDYIASWLNAVNSVEPVDVGARNLSTLPLSSSQLNPAANVMQHANCDVPTGSTVSKAIREQVCPISDSPNLFGILCEPYDDSEFTQPNGEPRPLVILLSSGATHRIGPGRLYVHLCRQMATVGFRTLRVDLNGLGDSVSASPESENDPYAATAFRDVNLVVKYAQEKCGARRVVLMGLCSGAYAAFQSAVQLPNPAIIESVLINPLTYFWKEGMSLDHTKNSRYNALHYYLHSLIDPGKWLRLLSGNSQLGVFGGTKLFAQRLFGISPVKGSVDSACQKPCVDTQFGHPVRRNLSADLAQVARAGRQLALFCATTDPGHFQLMYEARRKAMELHRSGRLNWFFIEDSDHTFSNPTSRQELIDSIIRYLGDRYSK